MANEQSTIESVPQKRQRRAKRDPEFIFEDSKFNETDIDLPVVLNKTTPMKSKKNNVHSNDENSIDTDLYTPGDIVWSKLGGFPWWPALISRCDSENGIYTKASNSNSKSKRQYFVYFYGKSIAFAWLSTRSLLNYSGLNNFIQYAENAVQKASTKSEKLELADRYQLKVSIRKRPEWDEAIELADRALKMTKDERIKEFNDLLHQSKMKKKSIKTNRQKVSNDHDIDETLPSKRRCRMSVSSSRSIDLPEPSIVPEGLPVVSGTIEIVKEDISTKTTISSNDISQISPLLQHYFLSNIPPLSNFEQKQIVEHLLNHYSDENLTLNDAENYAKTKAIEIVLENYNYQMTRISEDWFYDSILLKYPSIVYRYHSWFKDMKSTIIPDLTDTIKLKQWQILLMINAKTKIEQDLSKNI